MTPLLPAALLALLAPAQAPSGPEAAAPVEATPSEAAPGEAAPEKHRVLALDLTASGVDDNTARIFQGDIGKALARHTALEVMTATDLQTIADLEGQKAALGCDTDSCLAEIAGAMGARYIVYGRLGTIEDIVVVQLNLFDSEAARVVAREDVREVGLKATLAALGPAVDRLVSSLVGGVALSPAATPPATTAPATGVAATPTEPEEEGSLLGLSLLLSGGALTGLGALGMVGLAGLAAAGEYRLSGDPKSRAPLETEAWTWVGPAAVISIGLCALVAAGGAGLLVWGVVE